MLRAAVLTGFAGVLSSISVAEVQAPDSPSARMFERMRGLAGTWEGTYEWSGARTGGGKLRVAYHLTGGGSALVEDLLMGQDDTPTMTTVYHLDGADLRMTHYCAARNQPRLKAGHIDEAAGSVGFSFVDVTNAGASPAYVDGFSMRMVDADDLNLSFEFGGSSGKRATENIVVKRVKSSTPQS